MADWLDQEIGLWENVKENSGCLFHGGCMSIPVMIIVLPALLLLAVACIALVLCILLLLAGLIVWYVLPGFGMDVSGIQAWMEGLADSILLLLMSYS